MDGRVRRGAAACVIAAALVLGAPLRAETVSLDDLAKTLRIDPAGISVSGVSSGGFMAVQLHVAHASRVIGAGIVAGGPYGCAAGSYFLSAFDPTGLYAALYVCSSTSPFGAFFGPPDNGQSVDATRQAAAAGRIDDPADLGTARIWLFSGGNDTKVPSPVVAGLARYYGAFLPAEQIRFERDPNASHAMITDDFGAACDADTPPFINDCDFDAAAALLQHIYGPEPLRPKAAEADLGPPATFDQTAFFDVTDLSASLHPRGHVYVPARCAAGESCRLHVAFHGCRQSEDQIGDAFYTGAGYNEVAEANDIVVLYPQTQAWSESVLFAFQENPRACWDWWGYSGDDYARRSGTQIRAVARMINALLGEARFPLR